MNILGTWFTWDSGLAKDEFDARIDKIRHGMQRRNLDALIIYTFDHYGPFITVSFSTFLPGNSWEKILIADAISADSSA